MFDLFTGKAPTTNINMDEDPLPVQRIIREVLRIARSTRQDRRKTTAERRKSDPDFVVELSQAKKSNRRLRIERRQNLEYANIAGTNMVKNRRKRHFDRRKLVNEGIWLTLSSKGDRRSDHDRRRV